MKWSPWAVTFILVTSIGNQAAIVQDDISISNQWLTEQPNSEPPLPQMNSDLRHHALTISTGGPYEALESEPFSLKGNATSLPEGSEMWWDLDGYSDANGDGNLTNDRDAEGLTPTVSYADDGEFVATLNAFNLSGGGQDAVFIIDSSQSMSYNDPSAIRVAAASQYIHSLSSQDRAAIVGLARGNYSANDAWLTNELAGEPHHLTNLDATGKALMATDAESLNFTNGGTNIEQALYFGLRELVPGYNVPPEELCSWSGRPFPPPAGNGAADHSWIVILLTDGRGAYDDSCTEDEVAVAVFYSVTIFTVGLGEFVDAPYLENLSAPTGGSYHFAENAKDLPTIYQDIFQRTTEPSNVSLSTKVTIRNVAPHIVVAVPSHAMEGERIRADVTFEDPGTDDVTIEWSWSYGPTGTRTFLNDPARPDPPRSLVGQSPFRGNCTQNHTYGDDGAFTLRVSACDDDGGCSEESKEVTILNVAPSVTTYSSKGVEGTPLSLSARVSDPGSDDLFLTWSWGDGTPDETSVYYNNGVSPDPYPSPDINPRDVTDVKSHAYGDNGAFTVTVFVRDDDSGNQGITLQITATPDNLPPSANVSGEMNIDEGQSVALTATATDPGSDDLKFSWSWGDGSSESRIYYNDGIGPDPPQSPGGTWPFTATDTATHPYGDNGQYTVALTVADDDGGSTTWSGQVIVNNLPPSIKPFGPFTVDEGRPLSPSATATDPGSDDLTFTWRFELGPTTSNTHYNNGVSPDPYPSPGPVYPIATTDSITATYGDNGVFVLNLTVKDDDGGVSWYETEIIVVNTPPLIQPFGPFTVDEGSPLNVSANATDAGSDDLTFLWSFELGPTIQSIHYSDDIGPDPTKSPWGAFSFGATDSASHTYGDNAVYVVNLTVTDDDGGAAYYSTEVTVLNLPPSIKPFGPFHIGESDPLTIDTSAIEAGSDDLTFTWTWDYGPTFHHVYYNDGIGPDPAKSPWGTFTFGAADSTSHTYGDNGIFNVSLKVEDDDGGSAWYNTTVTVDNVPPVIDDVQVYVEANLTLRVAGEKWHDVCMDLVHDGNVENQDCVVRYPGSPDDQSGTITGRIQLLGDFKIVLYYTPDDDPVNGQPNGANPIWVFIGFPDGSEVSLHHTFNVQHNDTWVWTIDDFRPYLVGQKITFNATATDTGSDDLTFAWSWGDGTPDLSATYFNNGVSPDPYPSPNGTFPFTATDDSTHTYGDDCPCDVTLTVTDDDGGSATYATVVNVLNVPPSLAGNVEAYARGSLVLRIAGEKWHDVTATIYRNGTEDCAGIVIRSLGSPDDQAVTIGILTKELLSNDFWSAKVVYTPEDDPINGQMNGADPAWIIFRSEHGNESSLHHTFNVQHSETWTWDIPDLRTLLVGIPLDFKATATDPSSDDLTFI